MRRKNEMFKLNNKGFSLIELVVVIALIGIISSMAFSMNLFGIRVFAKGNDRYNLNSEINLTSEYITKYIRFAYGVKIIDVADVPSPVPATTKNAYIYLNDTSDAINYADKNGTRALGEFDSCTLLFTPVESDKSMSFTITAAIKNEDYSVDSGIVPINMLIQKDSSITGIADGNAIEIVNDIPIVSPSGSLTFDAIALPEGNINVPYTGHTFIASGGTSPYTYVASPSARLPYGMKLSALGVLSGTPIESGLLNFMIYAFDSSIPTKSKSTIFQINIKNTAVGANASVASDVHITGPSVNETDKTAIKGSTLTTSYIFSDPEAPGETEGATTFQWYRGTKSDGSDMAPIVGETTIDYTTVEGDVGSYIFVLVTPYSTDAAEGGGNPVFCNTPIEITDIDTSTIPAASNVKISGTLTVGSKLTGSYVYSGGTEGTSKYQWYRVDNPSGKNLTAITGADRKEYTLTSEDSGKYLSFQVTPISSSNTVGDTVRSIYTTRIP